MNLFLSCCKITQFYDLFHDQLCIMRRNPRICLKFLAILEFISPICDNSLSFTLVSYIYYLLDDLKTQDEDESQSFLFIHLCISEAGRVGQVARALVSIYQGRYTTCISTFVAERAMSITHLLPFVSLACTLLWAAFAYFVRDVSLSRRVLKLFPAFVCRAGRGRHGYSSWRFPFPSCPLIPYNRTMLLYV